MFKKFTLVASMALAALAFAIPVSAASANWTTEGSEELVKNTMELRGWAEFVNTSTGAGIRCNDVDASITLKEGTTEGSVAKFIATNPETECEGTGPLAPCTVTNVTALMQPWSAVTTGAVVDISGVVIRNTLTGPEGCPEEITIGPALPTDIVTATPDEPTAIGSVTLGGTLGGGTLAVSGELTALEPGMFGSE